MSSRKNIVQQRALPAPIGKPPIVYVPYSFGQMKPLPLQPYTITLSTVPTTFLSVFIPANSWAIDKRLLVSARIGVTVAVPNQIGGPFYQENYHLGTSGSVNRGGLNNVLFVPSVSEFMISRTFILQVPNVMVELAWNDLPYHEVSQPPGSNTSLYLAWPGGPFDGNIDNLLEFQLSTSFVGSTDSVQVFSGQAYIQSPLDLRRLPR